MNTVKELELIKLKLGQAEITEACVNHDTLT
jgi:hypothetical protein